MDTLTMKIKGCDWFVKFTGIDGDTAENALIGRECGKHFHATFVTDNMTGADGKVIEFRQLLLFEHDQGKDKVGDVVIVFRQHPHTGRWMVQVEQENVFLDETTIQKVWRATRSSVDNIAQAVKRTVAASGWVYSNPRRLGGKSVKTHYVIAGWSPQLAESMMDVYDYVQTLDSMGLASFLKALQHMPEEPASAVFAQMRTPHAGEDDK